MLMQKTTAAATADKPVETVDNAVTNATAEFADKLAETVKNLVEQEVSRRLNIEKHGLYDWSANIHFKNRLTRDFANFLKSKDLYIANNKPISQEPNKGYKLGRQIAQNKDVLLPLMHDIARQLRTAKDDNVTIDCADNGEANIIKQFLNGLKTNGFIVDFNHDPLGFYIQISDDSEKKKFFSHSKWAEHLFRYMITNIVDRFCKERNLRHSYMSNLFINTSYGNSENHHHWTELDLVVQIKDRFYIFEVKSGLTMHIIQWARREEVLVDKSKTVKVIVCTTHDEISPKLFLPQRLMTVKDLDQQLNKLLESDFRLDGLTV